MASNGSTSPLQRKRRNYSPTDQAMALAALDGQLRGRDRLEATADEFARAAKFANVDESALRFWALGGEEEPGEEIAAETAAGPSRFPMPPEEMQNIRRYPLKVVPAVGMWEWARNTFVKPNGTRYNPVHSHLMFADIGFAWSNYEIRSGGGWVAATAEKMPVAKSKRQAHREDFQIRSWFGSMPHFLITIDSVLWADHMRRSELRNCALVSHELGHCGQALDEFGAPKWSKKGPVFTLAKHTAEEFDHVVADYGVVHAAAGVESLVKAALRTPRFDDGQGGWVRGACGTCGR